MHHEALDSNAIVAQVVRFSHSHNPQNRVCLRCLVLDPEQQSGFLSPPRFVELIRQMRIGVSSEAAAELFTLLDVDYNGYVDDDEFLRNVFPDE